MRLVFAVLGPAICICGCDLFLRGGGGGGGVEETRGIHFINERATSRANYKGRF